MKQKDRQYYEELFSDQPDVLDTETARQLLGGISISTVWKLIRRKQLRYIHYREQGFLIPKVWLIDYILSDHYQSYRNKLKSQINDDTQTSTVLLLDVAHES